MTLLTPAVLHCSALEHIKNESPKFHRKYILFFALVQGIWGVIFAAICFTTMILPQAAYLRETGEKVLTNAQFSSATIKNNTLSTDLKPAIWAFTIDDSPRARTEFVADMTGRMNRYYWDDRFEKGEVKQVNGICLSTTWFSIKNGTKVTKIPYTTLTRGKDITNTKQEIMTFLLENTDKGRLLRYFLILLPVIFIIATLMGALLHQVYILVVGSFLALLTQKYSRVFAQCFRVASGLYVGWTYVLVLSLIGQRFVLMTLADLSNFFAVVRIIAFATIVVVGYLCFRNEEDSHHVVSVTKVSRKGR